MANTYKNSRTLRVAYILDIMIETIKGDAYININISRYVVLELQPFFDLTQRAFELRPIFCVD